MRLRGRDSWQLRFYLGTDPGTGRPRWHSKTVHGTQRFASRQLEVLEAEASRARIRAGTLSDLLDRWLEAAFPGWSASTVTHIGSTWWYVMRYPVQAAHVLGKLLKYVGENNVLWGTDCLFYGSPQDQIQALRSFKISEEFQERYGYPELTRAIKTKILGGNGARLYGVEPITGDASTAGASWNSSGASSRDATAPSALRRPPRPGPSASSTTRRSCKTSDDPR
ncbi:MAG TPA: amidohydrolase family protein [Actinomycetota bacterium]|nr:amidohydrolase family protein [Actinomycetota bacterium]